MTKSKVPLQPDNIRVVQDDGALSVIWQTPDKQLRQQRLAIVGGALVLGMLSVLLFTNADNTFAAVIFGVLALGFAFGARQLSSSQRKVVLMDGTITLWRDGKVARSHTLPDIQDIKHGKASIERGLFLDVNHTGLVEFMHSLSVEEARFMAYALRQALFEPDIAALVDASDETLLVDDNSVRSETQRS